MTTEAAIEYLVEAETAKYIKRSVHTLRKDRHLGKGLPYVKLGGQVLYRRVDVDRYLEDHVIQPAN